MRRRFHFGSCRTGHIYILIIGNIGVVDIVIGDVVIGNIVICGVIGNVIGRIIRGIVNVINGRIINGGIVIGNTVNRIIIINHRRPVNNGHILILFHIIIIHMRTGHVLLGNKGPNVRRRII